MGGFLGLGGLGRVDGEIGPDSGGKSSPPGVWPGSRWQEGTGSGVVSGAVRTAVIAGGADSPLKGFGEGQSFPAGSILDTVECGKARAAQAAGLNGHHHGRSSFRGITEPAAPVRFQDTVIRSSHSLLRYVCHATPARIFIRRYRHRLLKTIFIWPHIGTFANIPPVPD